jgi:hypothetical protein
MYGCITCGIAVILFLGPLVTYPFTEQVLGVDTDSLEVRAAHFSRIIQNRREDRDDADRLYRQAIKR